MVNVAHLVGNVGKDPEVRTTGSGQQVASFSLATSRRWKDRGHLSVRKKFPQSPDKIDLLVCAVLAVEARGDVMREPEPEVKKPGRLLVF